MVVVSEIKVHCLLVFSPHVKRNLEIAMIRLLLSDVSMISLYIKIIVLNVKWLQMYLGW